MSERKEIRRTTGAGTPLISVVVVNYNTGELLTSCVGSVLDSNLPVELVISDNSSTDDSLELVRTRFGTDPRLVLVENGTNLGFAAANNRVLDRAIAPYILFLNPDCILQPNALSRLIEFMGRTTDAGMAGCVIRNPDGSEQKGSRRRIPDPWIGLVRFLHLERFSHRLKEKRLDLVDEPLPKHPVEVEAISGSLMLVRQAALAEVGPLDEGYFLHCEDLDWFARFARSGWKIYLVPDVDVTHHQGACSKSRPVRVEWHKHRGMVRFFRKFQANDYSLPFGLLVMVGIWAHFAAMVCVAGVRSLAARSTQALARVSVK